MPPDSLASPVSAPLPAAPATAPLLELRALALSIAGEPILKGISLHLAPGETLAITGESGSGKSLTALSVMQLLPDGAQLSGSVRLGGRELLGASERALCRLRGREVGMVFQEPMSALNPLMSIGAQVAEALRLHRGASRRAAQAGAAQVLARVGLPGAEFPPSRYPHQLSGGQRQRVVIALAIAAGPRLLIADEPTTALDVTTQAQILALLKRLVAEDGMGLLMITHDLAVVADMADRIAVMRAGAVVETGPARAVLAAPAHPYTRMLRAASAHRVQLAPLPAAPDSLLEAQEVVRSYRLPRAHPFARPHHLRAVDGVSLSIRRGERVGLVGESGCGKSTLARALLGLEPVQGGEIRLGGAPVTAAGRTLRRRVQAVFQDPYGSFDPRQKVARLICEPFHLLDTPPRGAARAARTAEALLEVGLRPEDADRYIHEFSGGQRQRLALARALMIRPELLILDEAVSALDVSVRAQILDLLAGFSARLGLAYLFVSHDLSVVAGITERVLVMQGGRIVEEGPTAEVLSRPRHPYTQALLASAPRLPEMTL